VNSKKSIPVCLVALIVLAGVPADGLDAQIVVDTAYAAGGTRPFDSPVDPNLYLIRPGERLEVVFLNTNLSTLHLTVNAEGRLVHRDLGVLDLSGKTLSQAREILLDPLKRLYNADEIVISINSIYPVAIHVSGMVNRPGTYLGYTSQRVSEIIDSAGGVIPGGSTRHIRFVGGADDIRVDLDFHRFASDDSYNPCLYAGTSVYVPHRTGTEVQIIGAVVLPRAVEMSGGETLADMIALAGGYLPTGDPTAAYLLNDSTRDLNLLRPGDVVLIPEKAEAAETRTVTLWGEIRRPGKYDLPDQMTLADLLQVAGGFPSEANRDRVTVFRRAETDALGRRTEGRYPLVPIDENRFGHLFLVPGDSVYVPRLVGYVSVSGLVTHPGMVPYSGGRTVDDYIRMAGGFTDPVVDPVMEVVDRISMLVRVATLRTIVYDGDRIIVSQGDEGR